jgi:hypothetical protein
MEQEFDWVKYAKKGNSEMRKVTDSDISFFKRYGKLSNRADGETVDVSISQADRKNGSPKIGDMIARNPKNHKDQWLVSREFFESNYEINMTKDEFMEEAIKDASERMLDLSNSEGPRCFATWKRKGDMSIGSCKETDPEFLGVDAKAPARFSYKIFFYKDKGEISVNYYSRSLDVESYKTFEVNSLRDWIEISYKLGI